MSKKTVLAVCAAAVMGVGANAAFAGEVTGNGKPTQGTAHARSICAFSGQNDYPSDSVGSSFCPEGARWTWRGRALRGLAVSGHLTRERGIGTDTHDRGRTDGEHCLFAHRTSRCKKAPAGGLPHRQPRAVEPQKQPLETRRNG